MKLIAASAVALAALVAAFVICSGVQFAAAATVAAGSAAQPAVGLHAPDRYDGIPEMCLKPMDFGYCRAKVKRYYFDMRRMKCAMFYWGGCAGNINNFKSLDECNKMCLDDSYFEEVNDNSNRNSISGSSGGNKNNNSNQNVKSNINNFKPISNYKNEQRRFGAGVKFNDNSNNRNDNPSDDQDEEADYEQ